MVSKNRSICILDSDFWPSVTFNVLIKILQPLDNPHVQPFLQATCWKHIILGILFWSMQLWVFSLFPFKNGRQSSHHFQMAQNSFVHLQQCLGDTWASAPLHPDIPLCAARELLASFNREAAAEEKGSREEGLWVASNVLQSLLSTASEPVLRDKRVLQASLPYPTFNPIGLSICLWTLVNSVLELTSLFQWRKGKDHQCFSRRKIGLPAFMQISQVKE